MKYYFLLVLTLLFYTKAALTAQVIELPVFDQLTKYDIELQGEGDLIVRLKGLSPGDHYTVHLYQDKFSPILTTGNLPTGVTIHDNQRIEGITKDGAVQFCLNVAVASVPTFRIYTKKGKWQKPDYALKFAENALVVEGSEDIDYMLNTIFRRDSCFELSPDTLIGSNQVFFPNDPIPRYQTGIFRNGMASVGIDSGIIISNGYIESAPGPNIFSIPQSSSTDPAGLNFDPDAASLVPAGVPVHDIASLSFEFIPTTDTVTFNYVFFSEDYCVPQGLFTNDAFGFLLTGPDGITRNIARLPVSGDIVSAASLGPTTPDFAYFRNNTTSDFDDACPGPPPPPELLAGIAYNGLSTILQAKGAVVPCAPHTLKIIVLDAEFDFQDSGVLLEAGSFLAGLVNKPEPNTTAIIDELTPVEGCDSVTIRFTRRTIEESFINTDLPVKYNVIPYSGTENEAVRATGPANSAGADYILPESPFIIPAGDTSAVLTIPVLNDTDFSEGIEAFVVRYDGTCYCSENADTFFIQDNVPIEIDLGPDLTSCAGVALELTASHVGDNDNFTYSWPDPSLTGQQITYIATGRDTNIVVTVTDDCGRVGIDSVFIQAPDFDVELTGRFSLCNQAVINVPLFVDGPVDSYTISLTIDSAGTQVQRTLITSGGGVFIPIDYPATLTIDSIINATGCAGGIIGGFATVVDPMISFNAILEDIPCQGDFTGSIALLNASPTPVNYTWEDVPDNTGVRTDLAAGTYSLTISDAADPSCFRDTSFVLTEPAAMALGISNPGVSCQGETITLSPMVSGGAHPYLFDWDNGLGADSLYTITTAGGMTAFPLAVTDACGVTLRDTAFFDLSDTRAGVSGNYSVCNTPFNTDVPITLSGIGPFTFVVNENGIGRTLTATGDTVLNYTAATTVQLISVIGADNCPGEAGGIANVTDGNFGLDVDQTNVGCNGATTGAISIIVNGNNSIYDFSWGQAGLDGPNVSALPSGTYTLTITDQTPSACTFDTTFNILQPVSAITLANDSLRAETCRSLAFGSARYSGGTGQLTYRWSNGTTGNVLGDVPAGLYTLSVTDENNCEITQIFDLQDQTSTVLAAISASATELSCTQLSLEISAAQNTGAANHEWTNNAGISLGTTRSISIVTPGRYFVLVTNPDNGCSAVDSIDIGQSGDLLNLELQANYALNCVANTVDLNVSHPAFTGAVSYEWTFNGSIVGTGATLPNISTQGVYEVEVTRTDNGCQSVALTEVIIDRTAPVVTVSERTVSTSCRTPESTIGVAANGPNSFSWSTTNGNLVGATDQAFTTTDRAGSYTVIVTDTTNGCTTMETISVVLDGETLTANAGTDQTLICTGLGTVLNGSFSPSLARTETIWFDPAGNEIGEGTQVFTTVSGLHTLEVIHPVSGCSSFDTVLVINNGPTAVTYTLLQPPCPEVGGRLFVNSATGLNGPFDFSSPTGQTELFIDGLRGLQEGENVLVVTDQLGCELRDTFMIFEGEGFMGNAPDVTIDLGDEANLGVTTNRTEGQLVSWDWGNLNDSLACLNCPDPTTSPLESFIATVAITDSNGCELVLRQNVIVDEGDLIYTPTAFSPANGDGLNDVYTVFGNAEFVTSVNYLRIFNRWGSQVYGIENFPVNDPGTGWNGYMPNGQLSPSGVYTFVVSFQRFDGDEQIKAGAFTLVR